MGLRLNPVTGQLDICGGSSQKWVFNPFIGQLDRDYNSGGFILNPFGISLDSIQTAPVSPDTIILWGTTDALEWEATNNLRWGN